MTLPMSVLAAVERVNHCELHSFDADWQAILTYLLSQDAKIVDLISKRDFFLRHYNKAELRLAAAHALLREIDRVGGVSQGVKARIAEALSENQ